MTFLTSVPLFKTQFPRSELPKVPGIFFGSDHFFLGGNPEWWYVLIYIFNMARSNCPKIGSDRNRIYTFFWVEEGSKLLKIIGGGFIDVHFSWEGGMLICRNTHHLNVHILESWNR